MRSRIFPGLMSTGTSWCEVASPTLGNYEICPGACGPGYIFTGR